MSRANDNRLDRGSWIAISMVAAAAVLYMVLFFVPNMRSISESLAELESKLSYVLLAQKSARATEKMEAELEDVREYNDQHDDQLLAQKELPALFSQISQISKLHDAITTKFEPHPPIAYDSFRKVALRLGVSGSFPAIFGVVRDLEALPTQVWIDEMKFQGPGKDGEPVECDLLLVVFVDNPAKTD